MRTFDGLLEAVSPIHTYVECIVVYVHFNDLETAYYTFSLNECIVLNAQPFELIYASVFHKLYRVYVLVLPNGVFYGF